MDRAAKLKYTPEKKEKKNVKSPWPLVATGTYALYPDGGCREENSFLTFSV
jgi:hypothetical protein